MITEVGAITEVGVITKGIEADTTIIIGITEIIETIERIETTIIIKTDHITNIITMANDHTGNRTKTKIITISKTNSQQALKHQHNRLQYLISNFHTIQTNR